MAGDSEGEGETSIGSTATKTTLPGQTKAVMKDVENMRKLMAAKDEKERALTHENGELKKRVGQLEEKLTQMFAALKLMKVCRQSAWLCVFTQCDGLFRCRPGTTLSVCRMQKNKSWLSAHQNVKCTFSGSRGSSSKWNTKSSKPKLPSDNSVTNAISGWPRAI